MTSYFLNIFNSPINKTATPTETQISATLNIGKIQKEKKSVTCPNKTRSIAFPIAPDATKTAAHFSNIVRSVARDQKTKKIETTTANKIKITCGAGKLKANPLLKASSKRAPGNISVVFPTKVVRATYLVT